MAAIPSTRPILAIFEPMAFPIARLVLPASAAIAETTSSGAEVPNPTMTRPTMSGEIPRWRAMAAAPFTKRSALQANIIKPISIARIACSIKKVIVFLLVSYQYQCFAVRLYQR